MATSVAIATVSTVTAMTVAAIPTAVAVSAAIVAMATVVVAAAHNDRRAAVIWIIVAAVGWTVIPTVVGRAIPYGHARDADADTKVAVGERGRR